jgi:hypothetical protein
MDSIRPQPAFNQYSTSNQRAFDQLLTSVKLTAFAAGSFAQHDSTSIRTVFDQFSTSVQPAFAQHSTGIPPIFNQQSTFFFSSIRPAPDHRDWASARPEFDQPESRCSTSIQPIFDRHSTGQVVHRQSTSISIHHRDCLNSIRPEFDRHSTGSRPALDQ